MTIGLAIFVITLIAGLYMAWTIGANDVANAMGTSVGSGALTLFAAIVLAGIFEFSGAVLVGGNVTATISKGIVEVDLFGPTGPLGADGPLLLAIGMLTALLSSAVWLHVATHFGLPVSTTHSIVGAVAGVGVVAFGVSGVNWGTIGQIVASWVVSPVMGGTLGFVTFVFIRRRILASSDPVGATISVGPWLVGVVAAIMTLSFLYKSLRNVLNAPPIAIALAAAVLIAVVAALATRHLISRRPPDRAHPYAYIERVFSFLQIGTACFIAFAHGANDVANAVGPLATVVHLERAAFAIIPSEVGVPFWVLLLGGGGIVLGLSTLGYKVIATIGKEITEITPTRGFSAEFGAATTVLAASSLGLPISTTHTLVGSVIGVGFAQGLGALNLRVIRNIVNSWVATVPVSAGLAALLFIIGRAFVL